MPINIFADKNNNNERYSARDKAVENKFDYNNYGGNNKLRQLNKDLAELQKTVNFIEGVVKAFFLATAVLVLIVLVVKLVGFKTYPWKRSEIIIEIGVVLGCIALAGMSKLIVTLLASLFINFN